MSQRHFFTDNFPSLMEYLEEGVIIPGHCCVYDTVECLIEPYVFFIVTVHVLAASLAQFWN